MRILITTGIFPPDIGGPATYVPQIAKGLFEYGHEVQVLTTSEPEHLTYADLEYPFRVFRMNRRMAFWYRPLFYIQQILRHGRGVDIMYANGVFLETVLANLWLRKPLVIKIVGDEAWERATRRGWSHDGFEDFQCQRQPPLGEFLKQLRSWVVRRPDKVIVPSRFLKRCVAGWGVPEQKCAVIYNAVDENAAEETLAPGVPISLPEAFHGKVRLITIGRLIPLRNLDAVLRAVAKLPAVSLTIVGDGPSRLELEAETLRLGLNKRVWFPGALPHHDVQSLLRQHDIFILASSHEGFPHSILEAMQAGLAVVATAVGGIPEVLNHGKDGILVKLDDSTLLDALKQLVQDSAFRMSLASNARLAVKESFSRNRMAVQTESVLLTLKGDQH